LIGSHPNREEIAADLASIFESIEKALQFADHTPYGLPASDDLRRILRNCSIGILDARLSRIALPD
jgi:hypothetical protein